MATTYSSPPVVSIDDDQQSADIEAALAPQRKAVHEQVSRSSRCSGGRSHRSSDKGCKLVLLTFMSYVDVHTSVDGVCPYMLTYTNIC